MSAGVKLAPCSGPVFIFGTLVGTREFLIFAPTVGGIDQAGCVVNGDVNYCFRLKPDVSQYVDNKQKIKKLRCFRY
jgi:hypothetical protein